jgi:sugar lactone lactonase YvrE
VIATPTTVLDGLVFPEGPRWHGGRLWVSDMHGRRVLAVEPGQAAGLVAEFVLPSGLGFLPDGSLLVATMDDKALWRVEEPGAPPERYVDLSSYPGEFLNDMVVDSEGRAYVGCRTHRKPGVPPSSDLLLLVQPDRSVEVAVDDVVGPNGVVITPDGGSLILAETHRHCITRFDRDAAGRLTNRRTFAELDRSMLTSGRKVFPDGMCLDAEGAVWIGTGFGCEFLRVAPGGELLTRAVPADGRWAVACMLGGADRRTLFMATAKTTIEVQRPIAESEIGDHEAHRTWARTLSQGYVEAVQVDVPGEGTP